MSIPKLGSIGALIRQAASGPYWELLASLVGVSPPVLAQTNVQSALEALAVTEPDYSTVSDWYVDPITGNDLNNGTALATPLATMAELSVRIGSARLDQLTTVHVLSDVPSDDSFIFDGQLTSNSNLTIAGEGTSELLPPTAIIAFQNILTGTRPWVDLGINWATAGPGGSSLLGQRCRLTTVFPGTVFWIEAIDVGIPTRAYISQPRQSVPPSNGNTRSLAAGMLVTVEQLTAIGPVSLIPSYSNPLPIRIPVVIDARVTGRDTYLGGKVSTSRSTSCGIYNSAIETTNVFGAYLAAIGSKVVAPNLHFDDVGARFYSTSLQPASSIRLVCGVWRAQNITCQGGIIVGQNNDEGSIAVLVIEGFGAFFEFSGTAVSVGRFTKCHMSGNVWGVSTLPNTYGININDANVTYVNKPTVAGTLTPVQDVLIDGVILAYAAIPYANPVSLSNIVST